MASPLGNLTTEKFLRDYWQKHPCLIRQALPGFEPPLDENDIAGLACEPMAESRLVSGHYPDHNWRLRHGPFEEDDFTHLPESHWTLLVQDVEKHYPPLQDLIDRFNFLPTWRLDDLMVSYAALQGSVGPHVDQYDVFLYQASGQKLWQIAGDFNPALLENCALNVLCEFEPEKEWILKPGDMLYLPPNIAHHGVALTEGMTWSLGLRAPSSADLLLSLGEQLAGEPGGGPRYTDPDLGGTHRAGEINRASLDRMKELLTGPVMDTQEFDLFAGSFISCFRLAREPASPGPDIGTPELLNRLQDGARLVRNPWTRLAWVASDVGARLFAAGTAVECSVKTATELCASVEPDLFSGGLDERDLATILLLVNGGHLVLTRD
jgi:50S ribosomal protein L16 3-hydroxylase